jgi:hypothetical protein
VLQRKLLEPNDFRDLGELEAEIGAFVVYYNETARPIRWSYTVEKLEAKRGMN